MGEGSYEDGITNMDLLQSLGQLQPINPFGGGSLTFLKTFKLQSYPTNYISFQFLHGETSICILTNNKGWLQQRSLLCNPSSPDI